MYRLLMGGYKVLHLEYKPVSDFLWVIRQTYVKDDHFLPPTISKQVCLQCAGDQFCARFTLVLFSCQKFLKRKMSKLDNSRTFRDQSVTYQFISKRLPFGS